ncbi:predicted protein [Chaetoceros tenuissimus]|uniref:Uncharacterized protein n=1 Tax=Chaetoceros tenuissimus TaxID=426638 RepID=A0AAD3HDZ4_9STRA|nr:predicted protein [Chaetoceros tenuissimus]GFH60362.1 predicted protein [Chaetoceros tenuissimus]GFH60578.1 predicted protein [Chaetoceros tenuissimus]GFH61106.1 predicted protein [Chaetoceros tenuissimus]
MYNYTDICEAVCLTVSLEVEELEESFGYELNHCYVAGSFATHMFFRKYAFNDIDVFILNRSTNMDEDGVHDTNYDILKSYKVPLKDESGSEMMIDGISSVEVNIVVVTNCCCLQHLINFFDINCCQIGFPINVETGEVGSFVFTNHFDQFVSSRTLKVVMYHTPASSLMRVMNKSSQMKVPLKLSAEHMLKLKWDEDVQKVVQTKLFTRVYTMLQLDNKENIIRDNFHVELLQRSSEDEEDDIYNAVSTNESTNGDTNNESNIEDDTSFSFSFSKNGSKVELTFHGNGNNIFHFVCINGEVDDFARFKDLVSMHGYLNAFVKDELMLTPVEYILGSSNRNAIDCNNWLVVKMMEEYMSM